MGELVKFPGSGRPKQPDVTNPSTSDALGEKLDISSLVEIPSMSALYDEEQIKFGGKPIGRLTHLEASEGTSNLTPLLLERLLLIARYRYISEHVDNFRQRRDAIRQLGEYTWLRGAEIDSAELKYRVAKMLTRSFGLGQAGKMIKRFSIISRLPKVQQIPENPEPEPTPPQILPFRRRE